MMPALGAAFRVSLVLAGALGVAALCRRQSAAVRHWILAVAAACALVVPMVTPLLPFWSVGSIVPAFPPQPRTAVQVIVDAQPQASSSDVSAQAPSTSAVDLHVNPSGSTMWAIVSAIWIAGTCVSLILLGAGFVRLGKLASIRARMDDARWHELAAPLTRSLGMKQRIALLQSDSPTLLITWGLTRPKIVFPAGANDWSDDRARVVLAHELAHIARGDWAIQILGEFLRAIYWFNPIVWILCRCLRRESERACDDAVLRLGVAPADYASHLVELARTLTTRRERLPAPAMARPSSFEGRITAMLNPAVNRRPLAVSSRLAIGLALAIMTIPVAGLRAQGPFATLSGTVLDQTNAFLPDTSLVLTNTASHARYEVRSDRTGRYEFVGLPPGEYTLEASLPGFAPRTEPLAMTGGDVRHDIALEVGSITETISVSDGNGNGPTPENPADVQARRQSARQARQRVTDRCGGAQTANPMGGNIMVPHIVSHPAPEYPESLKAARIGGTVTLEALIGADGIVRDVRAIHASHPDLERAAVQAVRRWEFSTTFLNCTPIDVRMQVIANFVVTP